MDEDICKTCGHPDNERDPKPIGNNGKCRCWCHLKWEDVKLSDEAKELLDEYQMSEFYD